MASLKELKEEYTNLLEEMNKNLRKQLATIGAIRLAVAGEAVVYVLRQKDTNNYKIGFSTNYQQRLANFDVRLPFEVEEVLIYKTENFRKLETFLHDAFKEYRLNGSEFFALADSQIAMIEDMLVNEESRIAHDIPDEPPAAQARSDDEDRDAEDRAKVLLVVDEYSLTPQTISTSFLQRKLRIGYAKAARLKDWYQAFSGENAADSLPSETA